MSKHLYSERCPKCASKGSDKSGDNLHVYSDGHKWCFSCGYYVKGDLIESYKKSKEKVDVIPDSYFIPCSYIGKEGLTWLKKYGISNEEIKDNFFWDERGYLVFNGGKYQNARNFSGEGPKYLTKGIVRGNEVVFQYLPTPSKGGFSEEEQPLLSSICIVEDVVSAIKVSRVCSSVAIYNSVIPLELLQRLSKRFSRCIVWLDMDKRKESLTERSKASLYFPEVKLVWSDKDPKCYSEEEIKDFLTK